MTNFLVLENLLLQQISFFNWVNYPNINQWNVMLAFSAFICRSYLLILKLQQIKFSDVLCLNFLFVLPLIINMIINNSYLVHQYPAQKGEDFDLLWFFDWLHN